MVHDSRAARRTPVMDGWPGLVASCSRSWVVLVVLIFPASSALAGLRGHDLGPSPDRCRVVEPGVEVKLRLLDALDW